MRTLWINLSILAALLLAACGQAQATPTVPSAANMPEPTDSASVPTEDPSAVKMECKVVSISPTQEPTLRSAFPPPTEEDWSLGNTTDPVMTILEYSDFQ